MSNPNQFQITSSSSAGSGASTGLLEWYHTVPNAKDPFLIIFFTWNASTQSISACKFGDQTLTTYQSRFPTTVGNPVRVGNQGSIQCMALTAPECGTFMISASGIARNYTGYAFSIAGYKEWWDPDSYSAVGTNFTIGPSSVSAGDLKLACLYSTTDPTVDTASGTEIMETLINSRYTNIQYDVAELGNDTSVRWTKSSGSAAGMTIVLHFQERNKRIEIT